MRSFITALLIGLILIISGSFFTSDIEEITDSLTQYNHALYSGLQAGDVQAASDALEEASAEFDKHKVFLEATSDHEELLRIELHYAAISEYIACEQFGDALAACSEIELLLSHLPGNFEIKAENIL